MSAVCVSQDAAAANLGRAANLGPFFADSSEAVFLSFPSFLSFVPSALNQSLLPHSQGDPPVDLDSKTEVVGTTAVSP